MSASRAALVLERLLVDPVFRDEFRRAPAATLERLGLDDVARSLGDVEQLDARESRSSLAGVLMAAAVDGLGLLAREHADAALEPDARAAWQGAIDRPAVKRLSGR
jgi:hypothetical protein